MDNQEEISYTNLVLNQEHLMCGQVSELVDDRDSKSRGSNPVWVRVPPCPPFFNTECFIALAYIIGVAVGDGNLSNPNGRATRLRITCSSRYPGIVKNITASLRLILPSNKISIIHRAATYIDISCYSNRWEDWLGWRAAGGSKHTQKIRVPYWIYQDDLFIKACLLGLLETDGSYYIDRGYPMVNYVTVIADLAKDVTQLITILGYRPRCYCIKTKHMPKYTIRLSRDVEQFIKLVNFRKI